MKKYLKSHVGLTLWRIIALYVAMMCCRILFFVSNSQMMGEIASPLLLMKGSLQFDTVSILYGEGVWILLSLLPLPLLIRQSKLWRRVLFGIYSTLAAIIISLNIADSIYFHYTQKRFTADEIFFADNSNSLQLIFKFASENWLLVCGGVAIMALLIWAARPSAKPTSPFKKWWQYYPSATLALALSVGLAIGGIRGGFTRMTRPITLSNATLYAENSAQANLILSNPFCILRTAGSSSKVEVPEHFSSQELEQIFSPEHYPTPSADSLGLKGRNVVIFIMESFSAEHSKHLREDLYADHEGYTPFLDSLMRSGYCFKRMYSNGMRSIQAMPSILGSIPSLKTPFVLMPQALGESRQLPQILKDKGYTTSFFCGSEAGSMGFGAYARSAGIDQLFAREDYEAKYGKEDFDGYWGIWDDKFLQFVGEELTKMREPFFSTMFTLSSHHPFVTPERLKGQLPEGKTAIQPCAAYVDRGFREFFHRFGNQEWLKRTIFVFVADHVSSERYSQEAKSWPGDHHILGFIYAPESELRGEFYEPTQQIDIMPTILGLLCNEEPYFAYGRDIFSSNEEPWAISYENGFQVVTSQESYLYAPGAIPDSDIGRRIKAFEQQYYQRLQERNYTVK